MPFQPDPFQEEALRRVRETDVLVSAPTGAGKTWIALQAIDAALKAGGHAWYACPLKALSNAKFEEFSEVFGPDRVGLVTGDRKENSGAPIIVGTTEILRNQLYDCMSQQRDLPYELVVLDEAHYLGDQERGVVWEETLIYLPPSTRLLLLSATIQNSGEIAEWLTSIRGVPLAVVRSEERPVPLHPLFLYPDGTIGLLTSKRGLSREVERFLRGQLRRRDRKYSPPLRYGSILNSLRTENLLPAIFFLKSRAECDRAVTRCPPIQRDPEEEERFHGDLEAVLERFPYLREHRALPHLVDSRVAPHHAGHLPYWKILVEQMMLKGRLDAIFATSTVAGGVNFPARTVVLVQSDRFTGKEFQDLSATELQQMIGRAGRRGKDRIGFALIVPGPHQDPMLIHDRLRSPPDPIRSQIRMNFPMVLNLLESHTPDEVRVLIDRSLAAFQQENKPGQQPGGGGRRRKDRGRLPEEDVREALWRDFLRHRDFLKDTGFVGPLDRLTWEGEWAARLRLDHPLLVAEAIRTGCFEGSSPEVLAGMIAPFVVDEDRREDLDEALKVTSREILGRIRRMRRDLKELTRKLERAGFESSSIPAWPAIAVYLWAKGVSWPALLRAIPLEEGDMAMLITRTADHLNQIIGLEQTHPDLAETARNALPMIMRDPIWI
ncbi:MAG: DEAD/DEAH box helicase [bacterium]